MSNLLPQCSGAGCTCVPSSTIQERVLYFIDSWVDITSEGLNGTYAVGRVYGKNPNGTTGYFHVLDTTQANTTGPLSSLVSAAGQYLYHFRGSIATTACNILPGTTPTADIMVHARSALHKGQVNGGSLVGGGQKLSPLTGPGYMYYAGDTVPADGRDTYGSPEWAHRTIKEVGLLWSSPHPNGPKLQVGDISKLGGAPWTEHPGGTHQNGLNIDMRYVKNDGTVGQLDLSTHFSLYSKSLTIELLNLWISTGRVESITVSPLSEISQADVSGTTLVLDPGPVHRNHIHLQLFDEDGLDSNICES